jgi:hypothetical protein
MVIRDVDLKNVLMDPAGLYFKGWHYVATGRYQPGDIFKSNLPLRLAPFIPRCLNPPRYLFIDFGISFQYGENVVPYAFGMYGSLKPPEMKPHTMHDPYKVEIWRFGYLVKELLEDVERDLSIHRAKPLKDRMIYPRLENWVNAMLHDAEKRPTSEKVLDDLEQLLVDSSDDSLREVLIPKTSWSWSEIRAAVRAHPARTRQRNKYVRSASRWCHAFHG